MADEPTNRRVSSEGRTGIVGAVLVSPATRLIILAVLVIGGSIAFAVMGGPSEQAVEARVRDAGAAAPVAFILLYAVLTVLLFPGSVITAAGGVVFGVALGTVFSVIGASLGAGAAFLVGRWLGRQQVERLAGQRIGALDAWLGERGFVAVLYTRLIPLLPFNALNYALGVTSVSFRDYLAATVVGIIPGTYAYAALGSSFRDPTSPVFITAVALIVVLLVAGPLANRLMRGRGAGPPQLGDTDTERLESGSEQAMAGRQASRARYDLAVVGGGTAGLAAAIGAARLGARVCLVERDRTGGECLWTGCVPSKALLAAAELAQRIRAADKVGLTPADPDIDFAALMAHVRDVRRRIAPHDSPERLRSEGVEVIIGMGAFVGRRQLRVEDRTLSFRAAVIATGSRPVLPDIPGLATSDPLTNETVWDLDVLPHRLVVLGGGSVGAELGQAFARLGSAVTLIEMAPQLLPREDPDLAGLVAQRLREDGVDVRLGGTVVEVSAASRDGPHRVLLEYDGRQDTVECDRILVAAGRRPATDGLELEAARVAVDRLGAVVVDDRLATTTRGIYAAGDVTMLLPFTHVAAQHGRAMVANALFGLRRRVRSDAVPWVTFTDPELARVGMTEEEARRRWGERVVLATFDYAHLDRAVCAGTPGGLVKLVADPRGRLVGAAVAAPAAGEVIAELTADIAARRRIGALSARVHAYPTYAEGPARAADEYLAARWLTPRTRSVAGAVLGLLRRLAR